MPLLELDSPNFPVHAISPVHGTCAILAIHCLVEVACCCVVPAAWVITLGEWKGEKWRGDVGCGPGNHELENVS